jgi:hypothetical protein
MEIASLIIAILALLFSGFTYFAHDRKLKKQEIKLNEYQLRYLAQSEEESKKAVIRAKSVKTTGGKRTLYIYNAGKAKAQKVTVEMPNEKQVYASNPQFPLSYDCLLPEAYREVTLLLCEGNDDLTLNYTWNDDYQKGNKESQTIDL